MSLGDVDRRSELARAGGRGDVDRRSELARTEGRNTESVWEVFARREYEEPLHHVGTISEDDEDLALVCARSIYDEHPWIHMIIVPRSEIREAIRP